MTVLDMADPKVQVMFRRPSDQEEQLELPLPMPQSQEYQRRVAVLIKPILERLSKTSL